MPFTSFPFQGVSLLAINDFEGGSVVGRVDAGVDNKLSHGEVLVPVILLLTDIKAEVLLNLLVGMLCLSIGLGMVCSGEVGLDAKTLQEGAHNIGGKLWPSVTDKAKGQPMQTEDLSVVDVHHTLSGDVRSAGEGMDLLGEEVSEDDDSIIPMGCRQLCDQIHPHCFPGALQNVHRLGQSTRVLRVLAMGAEVTTLDVLLDKSTHGWPPVLPFHLFECGMVSRVSRSGVIMTLFHYIMVEVICRE